MQKKIQKAISVLEKARLDFPKILVGLSGGKDSVATLDLCLKVFGKENVACFNMFYLPDLQCQEKMLSYAQKRFGINDIIRVPAENFWIDYKSGIYG